MLMAPALWALLTLLFLVVGPPLACGLPWNAQQWLRAVQDHWQRTADLLVPGAHYPVRKRCADLWTAYAPPHRQPSSDEKASFCKRLPQDDTVLDAVESALARQCPDSVQSGGREDCDRMVTILESMDANGVALECVGKLVEEEQRIRSGATLLLPLHGVFGHILDACRHVRTPLALRAVTWVSEHCRVVERNMITVAELRFLGAHTSSEDNFRALQYVYSSHRDGQSRNVQELVQQVLPLIFKRLSYFTLQALDAFTGAEVGIPIDVDYARILLEISSSLQLQALRTLVQSDCQRKKRLRSGYGASGVISDWTIRKSELALLLRIKNIFQAAAFQRVVHAANFYERRPTLVVVVMDLPELDNFPLAATLSPYPERKEVADILKIAVNVQASVHVDCITQLLRLFHDDRITHQAFESCARIKGDVQLKALTTFVDLVVDFAPLQLIYGRHLDAILKLETPLQSKAILQVAAASFSYNVPSAEIPVRMEAWLPIRNQFQLKILRSASFDQSSTESYLKLTRFILTDVQSEQTALIWLRWLRTAAEANWKTYRGSDVRETLRITDENQLEAVFLAMKSFRNGFPAQSSSDDSTDNTYFTRLIQHLRSSEINVAVLKCLQQFADQQKPLRRLEYVDLCVSEPKYGFGLAQTVESYSTMTMGAIWAKMKIPSVRECLDLLDTSMPAGCLAIDEPEKFLTLQHIHALHQRFGQSVSNAILQYLGTNPLDWDSLIGALVDRKSPVTVRDLRRHRVRHSKDIDGASSRHIHEDGEEEDDEECAICMEQDEEGDEEKEYMEWPGCGHDFHRDCILHWISMKGQEDAKCPMCRKPYLSAQVHNK